MRKLGWCHLLAGGKRISFDLDQQQHKIVTYNGLESILNNCDYDDGSSTSRAEGCTTDSLDEDDSYSCSSKDIYESVSSRYLLHLDERKKAVESPRNVYVKENHHRSIPFSDVETMKEKFSKLLLGDDSTGGCKGMATALALSNAITNLAASVFGEVWKLEPLSEERRSRWQREMAWFLSPANYMVELVPAKQNGINGGTLEIMTPRIRSDILVNLPALQKLDSMLIETLDSMVNTEFWYVERGSRVEGMTKNGRQSRRWWLPSPQVPRAGLSVSGRKKLLYHEKVVDQVLKAAKSINNSILLDMPIPTVVRDALPKSGRESVGEELYKVLTTEFSSPEAMLGSLNLKTEHNILLTINKLEAGVLAWKQKTIDLVGSKSPLRSSWSFMRESVSELDKTELLLESAEALLQLLKIRFPNLPRTFLDVTKVQFTKDVGHSILEAYSRVIGSLSFNILSRIREILQEDDHSNSNSPSTTCCHSSNKFSEIY